MSKKRYPIREVPPGADVEGLIEDGVLQDPAAVALDDPEVSTPARVFDAMIQEEIEKEEAKKPPVMTRPHDLARVMFMRLSGLNVKVSPAPMSFPIRIGPAEAEVDYKLTVSLRAENKRTLVDVINAAIRAGQQDIVAGSVVLYLYAVQGHDKIRTSENGLPYVELIYIFRLRETTPKQEV